MSMRLLLKPQEKETTQHHDTRAAQGGLLRLMYNTLKEY